MLFSEISGNHAAALSLAAKLRGIPSYIVVPHNAPTCKVENIKRYNGKINFSEANKLCQETGAILIPSSNDGRIMR